MNIFKYKLMETNQEGERVLLSEGGVFISEIVNYIKKDNVLYLFLKETTESVQIVKSPKKVKITKENPLGWIEDLEKRVITEPLTLQITEADDIARWETYVTSINI